MSSGMASQWAFVFIVVIKILSILHFSNGETESSPSISTSVAHHICNQQNKYQKTKEIQPPLKTRPLNDDSECGWYQRTKCADTKSEYCPSFILKPCDEIDKNQKKGRGIPKPSNQQQKQQRAACDNSTKEGLPNPQIVSSVSKYSSLVTIERGHRCQIKYCTGLILNAHWIIVIQTGCFFLYQPQLPQYYVIVAGEGKMDVEEGTEQRRSVAEYIPHPGLNVREGHYYKDNIGLVRVSTPFEFNQNVQPIDLTAIEAIAPSIPKSTLTIVGWLKAQPKREDEELLASLIESPLDYVPMDECYDGNMEKDEASRDTLICAGHCIIQGDKKNLPLRNILYAQEDLESESESAPIPVGLGPIKHNFGPAVHGVFMNLAAYIPWIKEMVGDQDQNKTKGKVPESRVIRGDDAPPHKYKSMVNLEKFSSYACTEHSCGGSILNEEWVITAAHCVDKSAAEDLRIFVGDHDISNSDEDEQVVAISKIIVHENYNTTTWINDVALLKVTPAFRFTDKIQKATLPDPTFKETGPFTLIGWGYDEEFVLPEILQEAQIPLVPLGECQSMYADTGKPPDDTQICAGNDTQGPCNADSGGPLYQITESGEQILVGIVNHAIGGVCVNRPDNIFDTDPRNDMPGSDAKRPAVFAKVAAFMEWIRQHTGIVN